VPKHQQLEVEPCHVIERPAFDRSHAEPKQFDAVLSPVTASPAIRHGTSLAEDTLPGFSYARQYDRTGWPAATVRAGTSVEGLPIGMQVAAQPWREDVALALAGRIERTLGAFASPRL
jgi:amidase